MSEFIRARSSEQKAQRLEEIKQVAEQQFSQHPYHEITLTTIANDLGWSRANLYKYVTTKEEIFLSIMAEKFQAYADALSAALPEGCGFSADVVTEVWAGIANAHRDYFRYGDILNSIVETNVSVEKLADFKRVYYEGVNKLTPQLVSILEIKEEHIEKFITTIYYQGVGLCGWCQNNPLVHEALKQLQIERPELDFKAEMRDFISMCVAWYQRK